MHTKKSHRLRYFKKELFFDENQDTFLIDLFSVSYYSIKYIEIKRKLHKSKLLFIINTYLEYFLNYAFNLPANLGKMFLLYFNINHYIKYYNILF